MPLWPQAVPSERHPGKQRPGATHTSGPVIVLGSQLSQRGEGETPSSSDRSSFTKSLRDSFLTFSNFTVYPKHKGAVFYIFYHSSYKKKKKNRAKHQNPYFKTKWSFTVPKYITTWFLYILSFLPMYTESRF